MLSLHLPQLSLFVHQNTKVADQSAFMLHLIAERWNLPQALRLGKYQKYQTPELVRVKHSQWTIACTVKHVHKSKWSLASMMRFIWVKGVSFMCENCSTYRICKRFRATPGQR